MIVSYGILFMPPLVVVDIFVHISMQSTSVEVLEPGGCKLGGCNNIGFFGMRG
jgi:hypothetical protein